ncbi:MAG: hypothetical protein IT269_11265 [Saprospiraceae bacterium]|nr:hypothetical protein [Saprospiraceae bacterium]
MNEPNHIDELLRQRLGDNEVPPPTFVWPNIERELRRRRRRVIFWWMLPLLAGSTLWAVWEYRKTDQSHFMQTAAHTTNINAVADQSNSSSNAVSGSENTTLPSTQQLQKDQSASNPIQQKSTPENIHDEPVWRVKSQLKTTTNQGEFTSKGGGSAAYLTKEETSAVENQNLNAANTSVVVSSDQATMNPASDNTALNTDAALLNLALLENRQYPLLTLPIDLKKPATYSIAPVAPPKRKKVAHNCYDFHRNPNAWLTDVYLGPSLARVEMVSLPDDRPYMNQRLSTESSMFAATAGVRVSRLIQRHFLLRSGIDYQYWQEKFEYADPYYVKYNIVVTVIGGVQHIDTVGIDYGDRYVRTWNRFGLLDIPLMLGTEFRSGRSGFSLNAGVTFNVLFHKRGAILAPDGQVAYFTPGKEQEYELFVPKVGMSASGSVQWFYHVKPKTRIFAEPYIRQLMRPVNVADHPVRQRYTMTGIRLGMTRILD